MDTLPIFLWRAFLLTFHHYLDEQTIPVQGPIFEVTSWKPKAIKARSFLVKNILSR
jgi:hypothetical protein